MAGHSHSSHNHQCIFFLTVLVIAQLFLIIYLLSASYHAHDASNADGNNALAIQKSNQISIDSCHEVMSKSSLQKSPIRGVAVTMLLHSPTWFQRRYTYMVQNAHNNIPDDWVIQIFYTGEGQSLHGIDINPWIRSLVDSGRVVLTVIPPHVLKTKKKRVELMVEKWVWEHMLADKVLIFGGSSVICSNSPWNITHFQNYDYIGAPWNSFKGIGGDGGISIRSRNLMLALLTYEYKKLTDKGMEASDMAVVHRKWGQEDHFYISRYVEILKWQQNMKQNYTISLRWKTDTPNFDNLVDRLPEERVAVVNFGEVMVATKEQSLRFAGNNGDVNFQNWAILGTLPAVNFQLRDQLIGYCPEIKMHYPALHDPNCFGASPDGDKCALNVCALKPKTERKGGC